jgi:hypothetical protein
MRHFTNAIPLFVFFLIAACEPSFPPGSSGGAGGEAGQGGTGGSAGSGGSPSTGGRGGSQNGGAGGQNGSPACSEVTDGHLVVNITSNVILVDQGKAIRLAGWVKYPDGSVLDCFFDTGPDGSEKASFDLEQPPSGTRVEMYPGITDLSLAASCPSDLEIAPYFCSMQNGQTVCTAEIVCCLGSQELPLALDGDSPNTVCVTP